MGRLFWKIFAVILVTQLVSTGVVGTLLWLNGPQREFRPPPDAAWARPGPPGPGGTSAASVPGAPHTEFQERRFPPPPGGAGLLPGPRGFPWLPVIVGGLASLLFAGLLARYLSRPIMALRRAFAAVAKGNFNVRPSTEIGSRRDELAELSVDFEHTASQLKNLMDSQRRLLHDVSHEVRSPLARMQLAIDLARQQPEKAESSMQRIERESGRIDRLVEELLTLSRLEARSCGALDEEVDMLDLVEEVVEDARFEASATLRKVEFSANGAAQVKGRAELLQRAVENVVRNALRHTFEGTTVQVSLYTSGAWLSIRVEDDGPGLPDAALGVIFEPFVRFREDRGNDGYGLGLAITRHTIEAHGGSVSATNRDQGGLCIEMRLPSRHPLKSGY
ncbi:ATP-binding protein [Uliginosibacterium sp. 31-16]|uniref:ATP-binding protein n=1 Tax=Uliginosibacterium sp. 31-16 TaxID=3068315 RepID=UPI00273FA020|nr:ATP-binding protein [Uliginosibacterium sp. 31-16]MDP5240198.1 ATP-binding protein [Uliginosibacterium sp. 31-16]